MVQNTWVLYTVEVRGTATVATPTAQCTTGMYDRGRGWWWWWSPDVVDLDSVASHLHGHGAKHHLPQ